MRLKQLRKENRLRQADVAKVLNVTPEAYSMWESGARQMSLNNLVALSRFYGVSLAYLAGVSEERRAGGGLSADENALLDWFLPPRRSGQRASPFAGAQSRRQQKIRKISEIC